MIDKREEGQIEDSNDLIYTADQNQPRIFFVPRKGYCNSIFLINLLNKIGIQGGFDKILNRISDDKKWCPIEITSLLVTTLGECHALFHREFALEYIPKLKAAVWNNILKIDTMNLSIEILEAILRGLDSLLKRVYSIPERSEMLETLRLDVSLLCFKSDAPNTKIQGLKIMLDIIKQAAYNQLRFLNDEYLVN